ncbi:SDR family NAD(P)-dependent oxidoreductase [Streptomyces rubiginosohelvolus]|uniref:SDR family NAD(P)-dependent oxidoreductase n=1 Tax=Streptomyces rubiginosohelvolus TaxID=67362 RepID=UPI0036862FB2
MSDIRPLAVVTGASSGIGFELARQLAERGFDLVVNAEDHDRLYAAAQRFRETGAQVEVVQADLRAYDEVERFYAEVAEEGRPVAVAALNAGVGCGGSFHDNVLADELEVIDLNVRSTVHLAKRVLQDMLAIDAGYVLVSSSIAAMMPGSYQAVYNASKSFLQSFTLALQNELKGTGVSITALMPGPTETDIFHRAGMDDNRVGQQHKDDPAQVARQGLDALFAGKNRIVAGSVKTKAQGLALKLAPDAAKAEIHRRMAEPGSGGHDSTD